MVDFFAVEQIPRANLDGFETIENIELGQRQAMDAAGPHGLAHQRRIEPAAAALASGVDTEFLAAPADLLANLIMQFGRKRALPDPGRVSLADPKHVADRTGPDTGAGRRLRRNGVGGG